jgi:hypothetical protein
MTYDGFVSPENHPLPYIKPQGDIQAEGDLNIAHVYGIPLSKAGGGKPAPSYSI